MSQTVALKSENHESWATNSMVNPPNIPLGPLQEAEEEETMEEYEKERTCSNPYTESSVGDDVAVPNPRPVRRGSLVLQNFKYLIRSTNKGDEEEDAMAANNEQRTDPLVSPRKKTLKPRLAMFRGSSTLKDPNNTTGADTDAIDGVVASSADVVQETASSKSPRSPRKKSKPFMSLPRRKESVPVRPSKKKEKEARRQVRHDILGRIGGVLGESSNRSTTIGDSAAFLVDGVDVVDESNDAFVPPATHQTLDLDASERTTGSVGRFARVREKARKMVKRNSLFQPKAKIDKTRLVMLDDPSSEFSMELTSPPSPESKKEEDDIKPLPRPSFDSMDLFEGLESTIKELPRPSLESANEENIPCLEMDDTSIEGGEGEEDLNDPLALEKLENSITERRRIRRQQKSGSPTRIDQSLTGRKNSPHRGRLGRRHSKSHPEVTGEGDTSSPAVTDESPTSLKRRVRNRNNKPMEDQHMDTNYKDADDSSVGDPETPTRRRIRKINPLRDTEINNAHDSSIGSIGDPHTPTRRRIRRQNSRTNQTDQRTSDHVDKDGQNHSEIGDPTTPTRRNSQDPLAIRRRLKQHNGHTIPDGEDVNARDELRRSRRSKSPSKHGREDGQAKSPTRKEGKRSQSPKDGKRPTSDRSSQSAKRREKGKEEMRSRNRRMSPTKPSDENAKSESPSRRQDNRSQSPKSSKKPISDRSSLSPKRNENGNSECLSGNDVVRSDSPSKASSKTEPSESLTRRRDKSSLSPKDGEKPASYHHSLSPKRKESGQDGSRLRHRRHRSGSPSKDFREHGKSELSNKPRGDEGRQPPKDGTKPTSDRSSMSPKRKENGNDEGRARQPTNRSGSPERSHRRSLTRQKESESRSKGVSRRGRSRDENRAAPQKHTSEKETSRKEATNDNSSRKRTTKSLSPNTSGESKHASHNDDTGRRRPHHSRSPKPEAEEEEEELPRPPTKVQSYDPSRHRNPSDERSGGTAKPRPDLSRQRRHHPDDRSVTSAGGAGVRRHTGRNLKTPSSEVSTKPPKDSELGAKMAKLDALDSS